MLHYF